MSAKPAPSDNLLALPDGTELVGDYRIKRILGAGGFGITYLADEKALNRLVTIKEYFPADFAARKGGSAAPRSQEVAGDYQWGLDRFIDEAQTLARFDHPNIVRVHRYFRANNTAYMVLHFEEGGSFKAWLKGLGRAPRQAELDAMIAPLLDALELIHKANFLHRDIAPDNIMVRKDGSPVLIDFGSARGHIASHSRTVSALVKPGYSPYEQYATTTSSQGPWTDIYALGATLYHAITGKRPPDAPSRVLQDEYVSAAKVALGSYRSGFLSAIDQALRLEVGERPQSIAEWRGALLAPEPRRGVGRLGIQLPVVRTLARLTGRPAPKPAEPTVALTDVPQDLVPVPPDAPQPRGQLLDFIDGLKKHRPPVLAPRRKQAARPEKAPAQQPEAKAAEPPKAEEKKAEDKKAEQRAPAKAKASGAPKSKPRRAPRVLQRRPAEERRTPRPRRILRLPSRRWRSAAFKVAAAVAIASLAVAYQQQSAPRIEARGAGTVSSQRGDLAQSMQLAGHKGAVVAVATSDEGRWIVSAGADATLRVWNAGSGALVRTIELDEGAPTALAVGERRAVAGHSGGAVVLWDLERAEKIAVFQLGGGPVVSLAFTADPSTCIVATQDGTVALLDERTPDAATVLLDRRDGTGLIVAAARSRDFVAAAGAERTIRLWRTDGPSLLRTYRGPASEVTALDIAADGRYIASANAEGILNVWSNSSSRAVRSLKAHPARIAAIAFGPDRRLATGGQDGKIKLWNLRAGRVVRTLAGNPGPPRALHISPDGRRIIAAGRDGLIRVWSLDQTLANGF
jgi:serine/threonine protein kinase